MGNRRKLRFKMVVPVRIWGTDVDGKPFSQLAHTLDITSSGARVGGMRVLLNSREVVWVQCRHRKAQFRVVWTGRPGGAREHQVGIECIEEARHIWGLELAGETESDPYESPEPLGEDRGGKEHRRHIRYPVTGRVDVRNPYATSGGFSAQIGDVSAGGCYIQTSTPWPIASPVRLALHIGKFEMVMRGVVRTHHPDVGMGVEFAEPHSDDDAMRFQQLLDYMEKGESGQSATSQLKPNALALASRLTQTTDELRKVEELLKCVDVEAVVLEDFREALGRVRNTAWAVQRWIELQGAEKDTFAVVEYLASERIRLATLLCRNLSSELRTTEIKLPDKQCRDLLSAVEELFTQLAGFDFVVHNEAPEEKDPKEKAKRSRAGVGEPRE
ncbi:MAG TPA: PilZ domain-containing protein [Terriglobales bacterium]|nr:PilZ domain-containing protein [Terriglobales bacterium]